MAHIWTKISKASNRNWTIQGKGGKRTTSPGMPIGLLLSLTYSDTTDIYSTSWTKISKASGTIWTKLTKAT